MSKKQLFIDQLFEKINDYVTDNDMYIDVPVYNKNKTLFRMERKYIFDDKPKIKKSFTNWVLKNT